MSVPAPLKTCPSPRRHSKGRNLEAHNLKNSKLDQIYQKNHPFFLKKTLKLFTKLFIPWGSTTINFLKTRDRIKFCGIAGGTFRFSADYSTAIFGWNIYDLLLANVYHDKPAGAVLGAFLDSGWKDLCGLCEKICETFMKRFVSPPKFVICCFLVIHSLEINTTHFQGFQIFCLARVLEDLKLKCGIET